MDTSTARAAVKSRLDIDTSITDFDTKIDEFVLSGVKRLFPIVQQEVAAATVSVSVDSYGEGIVAMSTIGANVEGVKRVEARAGGSWFPATDFTQYSTNLYVRDLSSDVTQLRVFPLQRFTLTTITDEFDQAVIWYAMSEFYDFLAGNRRYYDIYTTGGARDVDNMRDEAQYFEEKANAYINDRATIHGMA